MQGRIASIVPNGVAVVESFGNAPYKALFPEEEASISRAVLKRRREFVGGRTLAREALARLGLPPVSIPVGISREPMWPNGVVGSITHCSGYCGVAVSMAETVESLGIDAELNEPLPEEIVPLIATEDEAECIRQLRQKQFNWDRFIFSAKESVFKAWFPLTKRWLGFKQVRLEVDPLYQIFAVQPSDASNDADRAALSRCAGRYIVDDDHIFTGVFMDKRPVKK